LLRIDLATGSEEIWDSGSGIDLVGIDGDGAPIIVAGDAEECAVLKISAPQRTEPLFSLPANHIYGCFDSIYGAAVDHFGIWLQYVPPGTTTAGIYLYSKAAGVRKVSDFQGLPIGPFS
jgi:hypothetical protein